MLEMIIHLLHYSALCPTFPEVWTSGAHCDTEGYTSYHSWILLHCVALSGSVQELCDYIFIVTTLPCACAICQCPMLISRFLAIARGKVARSPPQNTPGTLVRMYCRGKTQADTDNQQCRILIWGRFIKKKQRSRAMIRAENEIQISWLLADLVDCHIVFWVHLYFTAPKALWVRKGAWRDRGRRQKWLSAVLLSWFSHLCYSETLNPSWLFMCH